MVEIVVGIADGGVPVWRVVEGPYMANAIVTRRYPPKGPLWVDSGGYQAMTKGLRVTIEEVVKVYRRLEADYYLALDKPPQPGFEAPWSLVRENVRLYQEMASRLDSGVLVPVVHMYSPEQLEYAVDAYREAGARVLAVGGAVPGLLNRGRKRVPTIVVLALVRRLWHGRLHILGAGSPVMARIVSLIGADSADTATWKVKAAYGKVIFPGVGERYVGSRRIRYGPLYAREDEIEALERFLEETGFPLIREKDIRSLLSSFRGRALVNAWVLRHSRWEPNGRGFTWLYNTMRKLSSMTLEELKEYYWESIEEARKPRSRRRQPRSMHVEE